MKLFANLFLVIIFSVFFLLIIVDCQAQPMPYIVKAEDIDYEAGMFCENLVQSFVGNYLPGEANDGKYDEFVCFFKENYGHTVSPVIKLVYSDHHSELFQLYNFGASGIKAAILCPDGVIRILESNFTEILSEPFSCWGYPLSNCEVCREGNFSYCTQRFMSRCGKYQTTIYFLPLPLENYPLLSIKLDFLGVCSVGGLFKTVLPN